MDSSVNKRSLSHIYPKNYEIPALVLGSLVALGFGLVLPVITLKELVFWTHTFSVVSGIQNLWIERYYILAGIIFLFSIVFPIFKLGTLLAIWFWQMTQEKRELLITWLGLLGKWSMLDVFVVAITIVVSRMSGLVNAQAHVGIYVFGGSILLSMLTTVRMEQLVRKLHS